MACLINGVGPRNVLTSVCGLLAAGSLVSQWDVSPKRDQQESKKLFPISHNGQVVLHQ